MQDKSQTSEAPIFGVVHCAAGLHSARHGGQGDEAGRQPIVFDIVGSSDKTLKLYPSHFNDLLNDLGRATVMSDVLAWIGARLPVEQTSAAAG
ncbi:MULTISPECIES: hypothetical protein [unclassified Mesorhizobium]|uniref:hypothetical protein n=1 Tax=unclassified Mesorhizobium TaxID=325217 RepID=UPI0033388883